MECIINCNRAWSVNRSVLYSKKSLIEEANKYEICYKNIPDYVALSLCVRPSS